MYITFLLVLIKFYYYIIKSCDKKSFKLVNKKQLKKYT